MTGKTQYTKRFGQVYLKNEEIAEFEADQIPGRFSNLLEIGAGEGFLTRILLKRDFHVDAVEPDHRNVEILNALFSERISNGQLHIIKEDFLKLSPGNFDAIIGNIPYFITAPIIFQVLKYDFKEAVLMVQKEFADKAAAVPGTEQAGRLTYSLNLRSSVKYLRTVPKSFFYPVPGVDSAIIKITPKPLHNTIPIEFADGVIRRLFSSRRKKIKTVYPNAPEKYGDRRAETLSMKEFMELCTSLHEITAL